MAGVFRSRFPLVQLVRHAFPFTVTSGSIKALSGQADGIATVTGSLVKTAVLTGTSTGVATVTGSLVKTAVLTGAAAGVATVSASVVKTAVLIGQADGLATVTATLTGSSAPVAAYPFDDGVLLLLLSD